MCMVPNTYRTESPIIIDMRPMMIPMRAISFWVMRLVAKARALGGVEIGSTIALDAATATLMSTVDVPPMTSSLSPMARQTTVRMGIRRAAVAELLMKLDKA